jgi:hypothetical protein
MWTTATTPVEQRPYLGVVEDADERALRHSLYG